MKSYSLSTLRLLATLCFLGQATWAAAPVQNRAHVAQKQSHLADKKKVQQSSRKKKKEVTLFQRVYKGAMRELKGGMLMGVVIVLALGEKIIPRVSLYLVIGVLSGAIGGLVGEDIMVVGGVGGFISGAVAAFFIQEGVGIHKEYTKTIKGPISLNEARVYCIITFIVLNLICQVLGCLIEYLAKKLFNNTTTRGRNQKKPAKQQA